MTISATKILHSVSPQGIELKTVLCRYPRFIHAELMTHRVFSRNASSSRAIPVKRLIDDIIRDTAMPMHWGKNQPGMQAREEHDDMVLIEDLNDNDPIECDKRQAWLEARDQAINVAKAFDKAGYHKQVVNRLLEPFSHINVLITSTEWNNFFELRDHHDAQPEIQELARSIKDAFSDSDPDLLQPGEWHLPYLNTKVDLFAAVDHLRNTVKIMPTDDRLLQVYKKLSVARCARTSYLTHEGKEPVIANDLKLYDQLVGSQPLHASPAEHQATPDLLIPGHVGPYGEWVEQWESEHLHGNFKGWIQNRKQIEQEMFRKAA